MALEGELVEDGTGENVMDSGKEGIERQLAEADEEIGDVRLRMDKIREAVTKEVDSGWTSPWKSPDTFDVMVRARLSGNGEYQALRTRHRELEELQESLSSQLAGPSDDARP